MTSNPSLVRRSPSPIKRFQRQQKKKGAGVKDPNNDLFAEHARKLDNLEKALTKVML